MTDDSFLPAISVRSVPDKRLEILNRSPLFAGSVTESFNPPESAPDSTLPDPSVMVDGVRRTVARAELWWVSSGMVDVLEAAAPLMGDQPLMGDDPPTRTGLVFFERPLFDPDSVMEGESVPTEAILWSEEWVSGTPSLMLLPLLRTSEHDVRASLERHGLDFIDEMGPHLTGWVLSGADTWDVGTMAADALADVHARDRKRLAALWALVQQTSVAEVTSARAEKHFRKRSAKAGVPPAATDTRVVRLRSNTRDVSPVSGRTVAYSHRWIVSGHWTNQWYPSKQANRQIWIAPYVKGPNDKPLIVRETVHAWVR